MTFFLFLKKKGAPIELLDILQNQFYASLDTEYRALYNFYVHVQLDVKSDPSSYPKKRKEFSKHPFLQLCHTSAPVQTHGRQVIAGILEFLLLPGGGPVQLLAHDVDDFRQ